jgi:hypothetical protein
MIQDGLNNKIFVCPTCGEKFKLNAQKRCRYRNKGQRIFYCSRDCVNINGKNNPNWNGGRRTDKDGYILIHKPNHPFCNKDGYVREHRLLMENKLGRYLEPKESVHHIDDGPSNNDIDNLKLFETEAEHRKYHANLRERDSKGRFKKVVNK